MKSLTKKNVLIIVLSVVVAICTLTFTATAKPVKAAGTIDWNTATFEVMEEASIRIGKDDETGVVGGAQSGLRFRARVDADIYAVLTAEDSTAYMGFLITPKALFDARAEETVEEGGTPSYGKDDYINSISNYVGDQGTGIKVTKGFYEEDGYYYANAAVNNIIVDSDKKIDNTKLAFTAVAYIYDGAEYHYSAPSEDFSRTYKQVANMAVLSGKNDIEVVRKAQHLSDLGTSNNPIIIRNQDDFNILDTACASGADFSGVTCALYADKGIKEISVDCTNEFFANYDGKWKATATPVKKNHTAKIVEAEGTIPTATTGCTLDKIVCTACGETVQAGVEVASGLNYIPSASDVGERTYLKDGDPDRYIGGNYHVSSRTWIDYFEEGQLPTTFEYGTTVKEIQNEYYNGPAIRVRTGSSSRGLYVTMPYTGEQYKAYAKANDYNTVKVWMAINSSATMTSTDYMLGAFGTDRQQWKCLILTIDEFVDTFGTITNAEGNDYARVFTADPTKNTIVYRTEAYCNWTWEFLIGNIEFVNHSESQHTPLTEATCIKQAVCAICYQPYGELAAHTEGTAATCSSLATCSVCGLEYGDYADHDEVVEIPALEPTSLTNGNTAKISCSVCNEVIQESEVILSYGLAATEANLGKVYETAEAVYELSIAKAGVDIPGTNGTIPYTGNAFKISALNHNVYNRVKFNYTKEQYQKLVDDGTIKYLRLAYYIEPIGDWGTKTLTNNTSTNIFGVARYGVKAHNLALNEWKYILLTGQEFVDTFSKDTAYDTELFRNYIEVSSKLTFNLYISDIEMLDYAPVGFFYNGEAGFTPSADNYDRAYGKSGATVSFVEAIPEKSPADKAISNTVGYDGGAAQIYSTGTNATASLKMNYTLAEFRRLAEINGWTGIKFYYAWSGSGSWKDTTSLIGAFGSNPVNKVNEVILTMDQFYAAFASETGTVLSIKKAAWSNASYIYIGSLTYTTAE